MQDPSAGVQPPLDKHVHLICNHQYPLIASLSTEQATRWLLEAPSVVSKTASMSWTYVSAPQDGTIWLEWLSPRQNGGRFPSDGYVWGDPEQAYRQEINGYTVEILMHSAGYRPGQDHMTSHARTRYHLLAKAPHVHAPGVDKDLWIVHYHHAAQNRIMPANQLPRNDYSNYANYLINERRMLESRGRIDRRDFMLHDREHWPTIPLPGHPQQMQPQAMYGGNPMAHPGMMMGGNPYGQQPFPAVGPPSAKRQRTQGPLVAVDGLPDSSIEDDDALIQYGEHFDTLTPRSISMTRYKQHQQWMEEIFSSPYAAHEIVPVDLNFALMGELKGLTEGIIEEKPLDALLDTKSQSDPRKIKEAAFSKLSQEQVDEFNNRVQKFLDDGRAEIERMKAEHANKMQQWQKTHKLTQAERQLRLADWKGQTTNVFAVATDTSNGQSEEQTALSAEAVLADVEALVGSKLKPHHEVVLIDKGGLEEPQPVPQDAGLLNGSQRVSKAPSAAPSEGMSFLPDPNSSNHEKTGQHASQGYDGTAVNQAPLGGHSVGGNGSGVDDMNMGLMQDEGMDIDAGDLNFELDDLAPQEDGVGGSGDTNLQATSTPTAPGTEAAPEAQKAADQTRSAATPGMDGGEDSLFDEQGFDFQGDAGDGLIDFESNVDLGIDDSAFGEALHGMDKTQDGE